MSEPSKQSQAAPRGQGRTQPELDAAANGKPLVDKADTADTAAAEESEPAATTSETQPAIDPAYVTELEGKVAEGRARLEATLVQYKEALSEFQSVKARLTRDVESQVRAGKKSLLAGLLEVVDNLERALDAAGQDPAQAKTPLCQGVTMVRDQFHAKLSAMGVHKQAALGQAFDPLHFEAISQVPVADKAQDGQVVGVVRDAYLLDGETLRHGIVAVGKHEATT